MSTSQDIKSKLCKRKVGSRESQFLCFYGLLTALKKRNENEIEFITANADTAELFESFCILFSSEKNCVEKRCCKRGGAEFICLCVTSKSAREKIISAFFAKKDDEINKELLENVLVGDFFAGVFLACGSVTEPNKSYHLEMVFPAKKTAENIKSLLSESFWDEGLHIIERRGKYVLYMKGLVRISDFLTFIGISDAAIEYYNTEIYKSVRNKANRIANCDAANIERAVDAGMKQLSDIEYIYNAGKRNTLSRVLRETADLRLENPNMTLRELAESFEPPVTRSCINHRLKKISLFAANLKDGKR
jgi:DNA-binding protein WhiA